MHDSGLTSCIEMMSPFTLFFFPLWLFFFQFSCFFMQSVIAVHCAVHMQSSHNLDIDPITIVNFGSRKGFHLHLVSSSHVFPSPPRATVIAAYQAEEDNPLMASNGGFDGVDGGSDGFVGVDGGFDGVDGGR